VLALLSVDVAVGCRSAEFVGLLATHPIAFCSVSQVVCLEGIVAVAVLCCPKSCAW
jgi:hypothetical protein